VLLRVVPPKSEMLYCASTVGRHANEAMISDYVKKQGQEYQKLHENRQLALF
jgi:putative transposase